MRIAEVDRDSRLEREVKMPAHLDALISRDRTKELPGQIFDGLAHGPLDVDARSPIEQMQKQCQASDALNQCADCAASKGGPP
jgi:hypothetical protein